MTLRTRLLLALLVTSAVTLGAAALALLNPLQHRLEAEAQRSLHSTVFATRDAIQRTADRYGPSSFEASQALSTLSSRTGNARVILYRSPIDVNATDQLDTGTGPTRTDDVFAAYIEGRTITSTTDEGTRMAVPLPAQADKPPRYVLAVRRRDTGSQEAVSVVRGAFLTAALVGLAVALGLGVVLSAGIARRLARLRRSALALAADGVGAAPPDDRGNDEVGDLARALASMQRALRRQEEARRAFVATASHELRTPLTSLQGNLELLSEDLEAGHLDVDDAREQLEGAQVQLRRLGNLASELLDLSRLDAGVALRREPVELGELCRAVAAEFALRARERGIQLDVVPPTGPVWAGGDPGAVARVARILIDNALRFSPAGEAIRVAATYHGDSATLEVADRGPGVPPGERDVIFERFQRGSGTGGEGGFGLGLAIGRELAHRLDGTLRLEDDPSASGGACFVLTLPIELPRGGDAEAAEGESDTVAPGPVGGVGT